MARGTENLGAQQAAAPLTLPQTVETALKSYPSIRVSQEQINAAAAAIELARTAYLPRVDLWRKSIGQPETMSSACCCPKAPFHTCRGPSSDRTISDRCGAAPWE